MKKITIEIFIGEIKEDQETMWTKEINPVEEIRNIKRKYQKLVQQRINENLWRDPNVAGEYNVSLKLQSKDFLKEDIKKLEYQGNKTFG